MREEEIKCKLKKLRINHIIKGYEINLSNGEIKSVENERVKTQIYKIVKSRSKLLFKLRLLKY